MPFLPAASAEPRHSRGGAGGVRPRRRMRRSEQVIEVPERIYRGPHYSDAFKKAWCKMAALDVDGNQDDCNASVANLAAFCGLSKSCVERALTEGRQPGPDGSPPEFTTERRTHRGGRGRTARRAVRGITYGERYVTVPVWIADAAEPRELAAVLLVAHAEADGHALTAEELAGELFHHHGARKGQPLSERTARRLVLRCEEKGFLEVGRRAGYQGRHVLTVRDTPVRTAPDPIGPPPAPVIPPVPCPDIHDGSGPDSGDGSLASKEDRLVFTDEDTPRRGSFRRRRDDRKWVPAPVDNPPVASVAPATFRSGSAERPQDGRPYDGPQLTLSGRVWDVLTPVRDLLPDVRPFVVRRIGREIGRHLDAGVLPEDLSDQLARLRAWTPSEDLTDPGRWLLGAALRIRPGLCGTADCVYGFQRYTGAPCKACADAEAEAARARAAHPPHPWHECTQCRAPSHQPLPAGLCRTCHPAHTA